MGRIRRKPQALQDAAELWYYIATESDSTRADAVLDDIDHTIEMLSNHPKMGRARDELKKGLRSFPVHRFVIFYYPLKDGVDIVRILHGTRDLEVMDYEGDDT